MTTSFEVPFSNPKGWPWQKILLIAIIFVHAAWIVIHLNLVSRDLVNPWKVGGYGMYTVPDPEPHLHVYDQMFVGVEVPICNASHYRFMKNNRFFSFRCQPLTEHSLQVFFQQNPQLIRHVLRFFISEVKFSREPVNAGRQLHSVLEVRWKDPETFQYVSQVCGKIYEGEVKLLK